MSILEIRTYKLHPGTRDAFHQVAGGHVMPMLARYGTHVVSFGPSLHDEDSYLLMRSYDSMDDRAARQAEFYGSQEWLDNYNDAIMSKIESYHTVVIEQSQLDLPLAGQ